VDGTRPCVCSVDFCVHESNVDVLETKLAQYPDIPSRAELLAQWKILCQPIASCDIYIVDIGPTMGVEIDAEVLPVIVLYPLVFGVEVVKVVVPVDDDELSSGIQ